MPATDWTPTPLANPFPEDIFEQGEACLTKWAKVIRDANVQKVEWLLRLLGMDQLLKNFLVSNGPYIDR